MITASPPSPVKEPWLFRLALKYAVREVKKHPHTLAASALAFLSEGAPLPRSTPVLFAFALEALKGQAEMHPHTLLARAVEELRKAAELATTATA